MDRFLLVQASSDPTQWVFPKGHIEEDETPEQAALREVAEEAGVRGEILGRVGTSTYVRGDEMIHVLYFLMRDAGTVPALEQHAARWCTFTEARRTLSFESDRDLLTQAAAARSGCVRRPR